VYGITVSDVDELRRMGAKISVNDKTAVIEGVSELNASPLKSTDLRAGAAMIIAALTANGTSYIEDIKYIERGYEDVVEKFRNLGADIKRIKTNEPGSQSATA